MKNLGIPAKGGDDLDILHCVKQRGCHATLRCVKQRGCHATLRCVEQRGCHATLCCHFAAPAKADND